MKALTLTQPWATLVAIGAKRIETRSWATRYRGPLAIHAAKNVPKPARALYRDNWRFFTVLRNAGYGGSSRLPLGAVLAICRLVDCVRIEPSGIIGKWTYLLADKDRECAFGDYSIGRFAWILTDVQALPELIRAKGARGLWEWNGTPEVL